MRASKFAVFTLLTIAMLNPRCENTNAEECVEPGEDLDTSLPSDGELLPSWAVGVFGYHSVDISSWRITAEGEVTQFLNGGDFHGCVAGTATFEDGAVIISVAGKPEGMLVRSQDGRYFLGELDPESTRRCKWMELVTTALCGRAGGGGCGGFESSEPCSWEESGGSRCERADSDAGEPDAR